MNVNNLFWFFSKTYFLFVLKILNPFAYVTFWYIPRRGLSETSRNFCAFPQSRLKMFQNMFDVSDKKLKKFLYIDRKKFRKIRRNYLYWFSFICRLTRCFPFFVSTSVLEAFKLLWPVSASYDIRSLSSERLNLRNLCVVTIQGDANERVLITAGCIGMGLAGCTRSVLKE